MLQFSCRFAFFINFSSFKLDTENNTNFEDYASHVPEIRYIDNNTVGLLMFKRRCDIAHCYHVFGE